MDRVAKKLAAKAEEELNRAEEVVDEDGSAVEVDDVSAGGAPTGRPLISTVCVQRSASESSCTSHEPVAAL